MKRKLTTEQISEIGANLLGTAQDIDSVLSPFGVEFEDLTYDECAELDEHVLLCEGCNWWCSPDEIDGDLCEDCRDDY